MQETKETTLIIDVGKVNNRFFINTACIGIDADVAGNVPLMKRRKVPVSQVYNASLLYTFFIYKFKELSVRFNNINKKGKYTIVTACNGRYYGNGYKIAPNAKINDGLFDIYFADEIKKRKIPGLVVKLRKGTHGESKYVHKEEADSITIESEKRIKCNIDGESIKGKVFNITLEKSAVTLYNNVELIKKFLFI